MKSRFKHPSHEIRSVKYKALASASRILRAQGVERLNLRAIAEDAGIGIASIYHYFANKEDLLLSLAVMGYEDLRKDILSYQKRPEYLSPMRGGARAFFDFAENRPAVFSLMFDPRMLARHKALRDAEYKTFLAYKASIEADDRIPARHQENAALALWALGRGMAGIISSQPSGKLPPELAEKLFAGASYLIDHPE